MTNKYEVINKDFRNDCVFNMVNFNYQAILTENHMKETYS